MKRRVAIACSGLGWVRRGNESWAQGTAEALHAAGEDVVLFGSGQTETSCTCQRVTTLRRDHPLWRKLLSWGRRYAYEQSLFAWRLLPILRREGCDIVHACDPQVAWHLQKHGGPNGPAVIYKDGLFLGPTWNRHFKWVQVLAPFYIELARAEGIDTSGWRVIPHFVSSSRFQAETRGGEQPARILPGRRGGSCVVLAVGALGAGNNKRLDWVAQEIAQVPVAELLVVGQADANDRAEFERRVRPILGDRLHVLTNIAAEAMPAIYAEADLFAHAALREPFGIVFLEAMASGLPMIGHSFEVTRWILGGGGLTLDMELSGQLASAVKELAGSAQRRAELGRAARRRVQEHFSAEVVIPGYRAFYADIRARRRGGERTD